MTDLPTRAISIRQPWAHLIVSGAKTMELRSWNTNFRGPILIHAAVRFDKGAMKRDWSDIACLPDKEDFFRGFYVGYGELVDVLKYNTSRQFHEDDGYHLHWQYKGHPTVNRCGFVLKDVKPLLEPVPGKGRLQIYHVIDELEAIHEVIKHGKLPD